MERFRLWLAQQFLGLAIACSRRAVWDFVKLTVATYRPTPTPEGEK